MSYLLSVDLGTTFSAAALADRDGVEIFSLGSQTATIPSVVALRADGTVLTGEAADRRGVTEPTRVAREFKRRLGDPTPMVIGGTPYGAETLMADLLRAIVDQVAQQQAGAPATVVLSHPANYGPYKLDLLGQVGHLADLDHVEFITEPQAAAVHYLELDRIESGEVVAVYDLGGGTFDAALVRRNDADFELLGTPDGLERFGGVDLDEAVFDHVRRSLGRAMEGLDPNDPAVTSALVRLREDCRAAKEALSSDTDTAIPVMLPALHTEVRLTRGELEDMIRPRLRETMTMLQRVVASAGLGFDDISQVLLVGGSSRIPLVGEMVQEATGLPIGLAAHPKHAIALGAASAGEATTRRAPIAAVLVGAEPEPSPPSQEPEPSEPPDEPEPPPPRELPETTAPEEAPSIRSSRRILIAGVALLVVVVAVIGVVLLASDDAGTETVAEVVVPVSIATIIPTTEESASENPEPTDQPPNTSAPFALPDADEIYDQPVEDAVRLLSAAGLIVHEATIGCSNSTEPGDVRRVTVGRDKDIGIIFGKVTDRIDPTALADVGPGDEVTAWTPTSKPC